MSTMDSGNHDSVEHDTLDVLGQVLSQRERVRVRLAKIRHVVAVMSGKGGVGKSALTANLAATLAVAGKKVGVLDADIHGASAATMLGARGQQVYVRGDGVRPAVGVADVQVMSMDLFLDDDNSAVHWRHPDGLAADSYVWRGAMEANVLREFLSDTDWGAMDYLFIDMPPGADRFETFMRLVPDLSGAVVVTIPARVSYLVVQRAVAAARRVGARLLGMVENMAGLFEIESQSNHAQLAQRSAETFAARMDIPYLGQVPFDARLARTTDCGRPYVLESSDMPTGRAITALADRLEKVIAEKVIEA